MKHPSVERVLRWLERPWTSGQAEQLDRYARWLEQEGLALGGLGPAEGPRLWDRHLADSLAFGVDLDDGADVLDVGSGVGLPGVPLAIAFPAAKVTLLERSGRRADALYRVRSILGLDVAVVGQEVDRHGVATGYDRIVLRASLSPMDAAGRLPRLLAQGGDILIGIGRGVSPDALAGADVLAANPPAGVTTSLLRTPDGILDSPAWLLRMTAE